MTPGKGLLKYSISIQGDEFKGKTTGLLGNFNGDKTDDLIPKDSSTPIPATSTEREIFEKFGKTCMYILYL